MYRESEARADVERYQDASGMVCFDLEKTDGNDGPHKTGFWYGGLALKNWLKPEDVALFIKAIEGVMSLEGRLLRHKNTRIPVQRNYWQPGSRDQYQGVLYGLGLCGRLHGYPAAQEFAREIYTVLRYGRLLRFIPVCGRDIVSPQHWYAFGVAAGVKHKGWFRWLAGISEVVNSALLLMRHSESANILAYYRLMTVAALDQDTWLHHVADWMLDLKFKFSTDMRVYWTRYGGPGVHKAFLGEENEREENAKTESAESEDSGNTSGESAS
jgi:hypothetical protein